MCFQHINCIPNTLQTMTVWAVPSPNGGVDGRGYISKRNGKGKKEKGTTILPLQLSRHAPANRLDWKGPLFIPQHKGWVETIIHKPNDPFLSVCVCEGEEGSGWTRQRNATSSEWSSHSSVYCNSFNLPQTQVKKPNHHTYIQGALHHFPWSVQLGLYNIYCASSNTKNNQKLHSATKKTTTKKTTQKHLHPFPLHKAVIKIEVMTWFDYPVLCTVFQIKIHISMVTRWRRSAQERDGRGDFLLSSSVASYGRSSNSSTLMTLAGIEGRGCSNTSVPNHLDRPRGGLAPCCWEPFVRWGPWLCDRGPWTPGWTTTRGKETD